MKVKYYFISIIFFFFIEDIKTDENNDIKNIYLKYLDCYKIKIEEKIKEIQFSEKDKNIIENVFMNDLGKDISNFPGHNIIEEYENYINNKVHIKIKAEKPNKNMDFGQDKVLIEFDPENQKKYHDNIPKDELIYNVEEKDIDKEGYVIIIGENFCKENNDNVELIINGKKENLCHKYKLQKGINKIKIIFKKIYKIIVIYFVIVLHYQIYLH